MNKSSLALSRFLQWAWALGLGAISFCGAMTKAWILNCSSYSTWLSAKASIYLTLLIPMVRDAGVARMLQQFASSRLLFLTNMRPICCDACLSNIACAGTGLLNGRSEELLGQFVREYPGSDKQQQNICIATKLAPYPWRITSGCQAF